MRTPKQFFTDAVSRVGPKATVHALTISAALFFGLEWMGLNHDFPFIGEGFDGYGASFIASLLFWIYVSEEYRRDKEKLREGQTLDPGEIIRRKLFTACFTIPGGRLLFTVLPPWENGIGAVIGLFMVGVFESVLNNIKNGNGRFIHSRGTKVLGRHEVEAQIPSSSDSPEPPLNWAGFTLPSKLAEGNFLTVGAIGTGKTRTHRDLMASVFSHFKPCSDVRALVYDVKSDALAELESMNLPCPLIVMDPYDKRSWGWDTAADIVTSSDAMNFAQALIQEPSGGGDKRYFTDAGRNIVAAVIERLNEVLPGKWSLRDLILILSSQFRMESFLSGSDVITEYFNKTDAFEDTKSSVANSMRPLRPVAACWDRSRKFSLRQWLEGGESVLVLAGKSGEVALQVINRVICKFIAAELLKGVESPDRSKFWFFCDELGHAGRLESVGDFLNGRSKGVRSVLGFQDFPTVIRAYGSRDGVMSIVGNCHSITWLKLTCSDTAEWAGQRVGEAESFEYLTAQNKDGTTVTEHLTKREAMLKSEFMQQPDYHNGVVSGIHIFKSVAGVFKSSARYAHPTIDASNNFWPRDARDKILAPWSDEDAIRLGIQDDNEPTSESPEVGGPNGPDLDDIGRVEFT